MRNLIASWLVTVLQALYSVLLRALPEPFRAEFGDEMVEVFDEQLAEAGEAGIWSTLALAGRELGNVPVAIQRLHLYRWQKRQQRMRRILSRVPGRALFDAPTVDDDGRFSRRALFLEVMPFVLTAGLILVLTYKPPAWLPSNWRDPLDTTNVWAGALPLLALLPGLALGMPRWAGMITMILLPLLSVPVQWASLNLSPRGNDKD